PPDWFALFGVVVTVALTLHLQVERPNILFIIVVCLFWTGYVAFRVWQDKHVLGEWGFRKEGLAPTALICAGLFVIIATAFGFYSYFRGTLQFPWHTLILMLAYPFYGLMQQFLALAIVVRNLERIPALAGRKPLLVLLAASLFAVAHLNDGREMAGTFLLE